jgi:3-dehydrosphinganine reductase
VSYFKGRSAWVVGGSQGIGLALAQALAKQGCDLTLMARNHERLQSVAQLLGAQALSLDVADAAQVEKELAGRPAPFFLFNCAGLALPGYLHELTYAEIEQMNRVNYLGTAYVCKAVLPGMLDQGQGHILNVSSLGGVMGLFGYTAYCASKFAVMGFSEALEREVKHSGIRVSTLCPPNTRTPGLEQENRRKPAEVLATEEKVQVLEAAEVAGYTLAQLPRAPRVIIPSFDGRLAYQLSRWAPGVLNWFLRRPRTGGA